MLKVHKRGRYNIIIQIMRTSACERTRACSKNRRRGKPRNKAIRPMMHIRIMRACMMPERGRGENVCAPFVSYWRAKYCEERVKSGAGSCPKAKNSRIIEYHGLITGIKRQDLVWNAVSGRCCSV